MPAAAANSAGQRVDGELLPASPAARTAGRPPRCRRSRTSSGRCRCGRGSNGGDQAHDDHDEHRAPAASRRACHRGARPSRGRRSGCPAEITSDRPRATDSMASVAMNGGSLPYAIEEAVDQPARDAGGDGEDDRERRPARPARWRVQARTVADSAATEPTDRSMPAETITKVTPKARIAVTAAWTPTLSRLSVVRKSPDSSRHARRRGR